MLSPRLSGVDPQKIRMTGAVFWAVMVAGLLPLWLMNPVEFSPEMAGTKLMQTPVLTDNHVPELVPNSATPAAAIPEASVAANESPEKSMLFIEKPLTTQAPEADPEKAMALQQPLQIRDTIPTKHAVSNTPTLTRLNNLPPVQAGGTIWVQVASYHVEAIALDNQAKLRQLGMPSKLTVSKDKKGRNTYLLRVGPYKTTADAHKVQRLVDQYLKAKSMVIGR